MTSMSASRPAISSCLAQSVSSLLISDSFITLVRVGCEQRFEQLNAIAILVLQRFTHFNSRFVHQLAGYFIGESLQRLLRIDLVLQLRQGFLDRLLLDQFGAIAQLSNMIRGLVGFQPLIER